MVLFIPILFALAVLFGVQWSADIHAARVLEKGRAWSSPIYRATLVFALLLTMPALFVALSGQGGRLAHDPWMQIASVFIAGLISYTWYRFLTWLDVFEPEKQRMLALTFLLACALMPLVMIVYRQAEALTHWRIDGDPWHDARYSVLVIGVIEEFFKIIPYLLVLRLSTRIDEPYDHLLYGSISALGFAFIENIQYLYFTDLAAVAGRALYAAVAHMFFTSIICYSIAIARHRGKGGVWMAGAVGFLLAALGHGFYDFWMLSPGRPRAITLVFFLGTIQLWVIMKNNLINISPFAQPHLKLRSIMFRYRIVNAMLAIFAFAFVMRYLVLGAWSAWELLARQWWVMSVMLLVLALSFSSYHFIPGYLARVGVSANPIRWFLPVAHYATDLSGSRIRVDIPARMWSRIALPALERALPVVGVLERRVVLDDDPDWYTFRPERPLDLGHGRQGLFLMRLDAGTDTIPSDGYIRMQFWRFVAAPEIHDGRIDPRQVRPGPRVYAKLVDPIWSGPGSAFGLSEMGGHSLS
ncbi:MAG: PrsW family intramembrane metalloprotease [Flavobacteriales bacterium]|nr:PrsW family intramembrane metalloprotease [Flavobacteriales bacterium]MCB9166656.1 PrsW family intramembrane metalloprotease [Flavobacteriales bacterium]